MQRVCAWCGAPLGEADDVESEAGGITHGICELCERLFPGYEPRSFGEFLNLFPEPIMCVDSDCRVLAANNTADELLLDGRPTLTDLLFGEVALCPYALSAPGCGRHEHCLACTVRGMVNQTFASQTGADRAAAYVEHTMKDGTIRKLRLTVTSEHRGELVLIRIDELTME